jgi:MFS family permease
MIASLSPTALRGRYQGLNSLTWSGGTALAPIAGGFTQQHLGNTALWIGCFLMCVLVSGGHLLAGPSRRRRVGTLLTPTVPDAPEPPMVAEPLASNLPEGIVKSVS